MPDVTPLIQPGLSFEDYLAAVAASRHITHQTEVESAPGASGSQRPGTDGRLFSSFVMALKNDRWFQISYRQTSSENIVVLQTEITDIVHENRLEKNRLIDRHAHFLQAAFDHMALGICTFSPEGELLVRNERFGELLGVPLSLLKKGTGFQRIVEHVAAQRGAGPQEPQPRIRRLVQGAAARRRGAGTISPKRRDVP